MINMSINNISTQNTTTTLPRIGDHITSNIANILKTQNVIVAHEWKNYKVQAYFDATNENEEALLAVSGHNIETWRTSPSGVKYISTLSTRIIDIFEKGTPH